MQTIYTILTVIAIFVYASMMAQSESAPQQAVAAGSACFFAILARIAQAQYHYKDGRKEAVSVKSIFVKDVKDQNQGEGK